LELEKDETSQYKPPSVPEEPSKRSSLCVSSNNNTRDEISTSRPYLQDDAINCPRSVETTNLAMPSTPLRSKRPISDNELAVFEFETFDDEENTPLFANLKFQPKVKKAKPASASKAVKGSCIDQNALHLMRGMTSSRRKGLMDCMLTQQNARSRRCPSSDPVDKKKRKVVAQC